VTLNKICALVAFGLELVDLLFFALRLLKSKKNDDFDKSAFEKNFLIKLIVIYVCVIIIPGICFFMDFGRVGNITLCGCAVLGLELANRDILNVGKCKETVN